MPIRIQCPSVECRATCTANESVIGHQVKCPKCGRAYVATQTLDGRQGDTNKGRRSSTENPFPTLPMEFGRYRVLKLLGRGGMGAVYLAHDTGLDREVALKIPFFNAHEAAQRAERFVREARASAALHHPNICTVFDAGQIGGRAFITMALIEGKPLDAEIDPDAPMPEVRAAEIARSIALALDHAHQKGVVHRDLKPANVMLSAAGPVVMDFGLAKRVTDSHQADAKLTRDGGVVGTPSYMSPEQVRGDQSVVGTATDVYALGVMLFEMLTGRTPYTGSLGAVMGQILASPVPPLREFRPAADERLEAICRTAMAKDPDARFTSMAAMAKSLDEYLAPMMDVDVVLADPSTANELPLGTSAAVFGELGEEQQVTNNHSEQRVKRQYDATPARGSMSLWRRPYIIATAIVLFIATVGIGLAVRTSPTHGWLVVVIDDPAVEAKAKGGRIILSGSDGKDRYAFSPSEREKEIKADHYKIRIEGSAGLEIDTPVLTIVKGGQVTVRVKMEKPASDQVVAVNAKQPERSNDPQPGEEKSVEMSVNQKMIFCWIPGGEAQLGCPPKEMELFAKTYNVPVEDPQTDPNGEIKRGVFKTKGFWLAKYPVTQGQYAALMKTNPSYFSSTGPGRSKVANMSVSKFPVEQVTWYEAKVFVETFGKDPPVQVTKQVLGRNVIFSLPHEDQWEYACRGGLGNDRPYYFGYAANGEQSNIEGSRPFGTDVKGPYLQRTTEVGAYEKISPHPWGLCDMSGNVAQWCENLFDDGSNMRIGRGGGWGGSRFASAATSRSSHRGADFPAARQPFTGFRLAAIIP